MLYSLFVSFIKILIGPLKLKIHITFHRKAMVRTRMILKNCPNCDQQVAIASKRCPCGFTFNARQANAAYVPNTTTSTVGRPKGSKKTKPSAAEARKLAAASTQVQRRRTGRVRREKPNYYDSLQYEKKKKKSKVRCNGSFDFGQCIAER